MTPPVFHPETISMNDYYYRRLPAHAVRPVRVPVRVIDPPASPTPPPAAAPAPPRGEDLVDWQGQYLQLRADLDNTKKRLEKRYAADARQTRDAMLRDLLPLADNLQAALMHTGAIDPTHLHQGVELTLRAFLATLARYGVTPIAALGQPFEPALHEAAGEVSSVDAPPGHVAGVVQTGYTVDGDVLRPARVLLAAEGPTSSLPA